MIILYKVLNIKRTTLPLMNQYKDIGTYIKIKSGSFLFSNLFYLSFHFMI